MSKRIMVVSAFYTHKLHRKTPFGLWVGNFRESMASMKIDGFASLYRVACHKNLTKRSHTGSNNGPNKSVVGLCARLMLIIMMNAMALAMAHSEAQRSDMEYNCILSIYTCGDLGSLYLSYH